MRDLPCHPQVLLSLREYASNLVGILANLADETLYPGTPMFQRYREEWCNYDYTQLKKYGRADLIAAYAEVEEVVRQELIPGEILVLPNGRAVPSSEDIVNLRTLWGEAAADLAAATDLCDRIDAKLNAVTVADHETLSRVLLSGEASRSPSQGDREYRSLTAVNERLKAYFGTLSEAEERAATGLSAAKLAIIKEIDSTESQVKKTPFYQQLVRFRGGNREKARPLDIVSNLADEKTETDSQARQAKSRRANKPFK